MTEPDRLEGAEARRILEDLARNGPPSAKVNAIRLLLRLDLEEAEEADDAELRRWAEKWGSLYPPDELERMREQRAKCGKKKGAA
jgi:hypothetical protein